MKHEDYHEASQLVPLGLPHFEVYVLSPVDLAVSKLSRFADNARKDIEALVRHGLTTADAIQERALEALPGFVGNVSPLKMNIQDAVKIAQAAERFLRGEASATD